MENETGTMKVKLEAIILDDRAATAYENLSAGRYVMLTVKDTGGGIDPRGRRAR